MKKTALSAAALHTDRWDHWAHRHIRPPVIVGHEFVGLIASVGPGVTDCHPGELVIGEPCVACGNCRHCLGGHRHLCPDAHRLGQDRDGAFADYVCMPQGAVWHADPRLPTDLLACFAPLGQVVRIARRFDLLGAHVLISGAGAIGCMAAAIARHAGARSVVVVDNSTARLELAVALGATRVVDTREASLANVLRDLAIHDGFDLGIETSGGTAALGDVLTHLRLGAQLALLGLPSEEALPNWGQIVTKQLIVHGIDGRDNLVDWERLALALHSGLDVTPLITHCLPVGEFRDALERAAAGDPGKITLDWES